MPKRAWAMTMIGRWKTVSRNRSIQVIGPPKPGNGFHRIGTHRCLAPHADDGGQRVECAFSGQLAPNLCEVDM